MHSITWTTVTLLLSIPHTIAAPRQQTLTSSTYNNHVNNIIDGSCPSPPENVPTLFCRVMGPPPPCFPEGKPDEPPVAFLDSTCTYFPTCYVDNSPFLKVQATGFDGKQKTCWAPVQGLACTRNFVPSCESPDAIATGATANGQPSKLVVSISADLV